MHITSKRYIFSGTFFAVGAALLLSLAPTASADVNGSFTIANCGGGGVAVSALSITWLPLGSVAGTGCMETGLGTNVTYSGGTLGGAVMGDIKNLTPSGIVNNFMTFQGTTLDFVLDGFTPPVPSNGTACASITAGQTCIVAPGTPFLLSDTTTGLTAVTLDAFGTITDGGHTGTWSGSFTTQLSLTPGQIQHTILTGGTVVSTYSASFTAITAVPEPASLGLIGAGLIAFAFAGKKRRVRS